MNLSLVLLLLSCAVSVYCAAFDDAEIERLIIGDDAATKDCSARSENIHPANFGTIFPARHDLHDTFHARKKILELKTFLIKVARSRVFWNYLVLAIFFRFKDPSSYMHGYFSIIALTYGIVSLIVMKDELKLFLFEALNNIFESPVTRTLEFLLINAAQSRTFLSSLAIILIFVTPKLNEPISDVQRYFSLISFIYIAFCFTFMLEKVKFEQSLINLAADNIELVILTIIFFGLGSIVFFISQNFSF